MKLTTKMMDNKSAEQLADLFNRVGTTDNLYELFVALAEESVKAHVQDDTMNVIGFAAKVILFTRATMILDEQYQNPIAQELSQIISQKRIELESELMQEPLKDLKQSGINPVFHDALAKQIILPGELDKDSFIEIVNKTAVELTLENPEKYRYPRGKLPESVQEHLDNLETIIHEVLHKDCSIHIFKIQIADNTANIVAHMREIESDEYIFGFSIEESCISDAHHYKKSHLLEINKLLMLRIANDME